MWAYDCWTIVNQGIPFPSGLIFVLLFGWKASITFTFFAFWLWWDWLLIEWELVVEVVVGIVEGDLHQEERRQEQVGVFVLIEILGIVKSTIRRLLIGLLKRLELLLLVRRCSLDVC